MRLMQSGRNSKPEEELEKSVGNKYRDIGHPGYTLRGCLCGVQAQQKDR